MLTYDVTQPPYKWATYKPHRRPEFKQHRDRGAALNAIGGIGILFEWDKTAKQWAEVAQSDWRRKDTGGDGPPEYCELCGTKFGAGPKYSYGSDVWVGKPKLRLVKLCYGCERGIHRIKVDDRHINVNPLNQ